MAEGIELWRYDCGCGQDGKPCWHYLDREPGSKVPGTVEKLIAYPAEPAKGVPMTAAEAARLIREQNDRAAAEHGHGLGRVPSQP